MPETMEPVPNPHNSTKRGLFGETYRETVPDPYEKSCFYVDLVTIDNPVNMTTRAGGDCRLDKYHRCCQGKCSYYREPRGFIEKFIHFLRMFR
jgi:hypothetical protein